MQKMKAEEALKYVIETVKSHLRELYDSEVVDSLRALLFCKTSNMYESGDSAKHKGI